ncbi:pantetheine-phosphate adenylyltransferase [Odoribacter sp. OttesenSCG-928-G04]|nr:pantetheine-phosphate adenylyltransferase [Odoribacter sp. OttesenSCG-928-G04]MDL2331189.1 pantetheine-phosphate adenylyltransferase [Odoribacter sp. OttesenSCG-928-A06]
MEKTALFPGSFDPFTIGHEEIVNRGLKVFDKIVIAIGFNPTKREFLSVEKRVELIEKTFKGNDRVEVKVFSGLTVDFCRQIGTNILLRGLRTAADFEYERAVGQSNRAINPDVETFFVLTSTDNTFVSSSIVRNIFMNGGKVDRFLPAALKTEDLRE